LLLFFTILVAKRAICRLVELNGDFLVFGDHIGMMMLMLLMMMMMMMLMVVVSLILLAVLPGSGDPAPKAGLLLVASAVAAAMAKEPPGGCGDDGASPSALKSSSPSPIRSLTSSLRASLATLAPIGHDR
jgi:hypothetical protein